MICVSRVGERISLEICVSQGTREGELGIRVSLLVEQHILLGI